MSYLDLHMRTLMFFFFQAEDGIRDWSVTGVQTCALPILMSHQVFIAKDIGGFGLIQRERDFANYQDLFNSYYKTPSVWVSPHGSWGENGERSEERRVGRGGGGAGRREH